MLSIPSAASKRNLSPKDTDLIDITLTTVFALDKLLHLLKDRRVRLDSLKLRLKWESEIVAYRNELAALFKVDIPKYLSKARWVKPVESDVGRGRADSLSLSKSVSGKRRTSQGSSRLSMFMNPNNSSEENLANALAIGNGRPSSRNSTWIPSRSVSTNAPGRPTSMSRQLIADSISLSLSPLTSRLTSINNTLVPATGKTLDAMIAKSRLPDQFFDVQDEIEDVAPKEVAGVGSFLNEVVHQWRKADEVWWNCDRLKDESAEVQRDVEEWIKKDIDEDLLRKWESGCRDMRKRLAQTKSIMDSSKAGGLPLPIHLKFSDQVSKNFELVQTLNLQIDETSDDLRKMEEKVAEYRFAVESIKRGQRIRKAVEELRKGIEANRAELKAEVEDRTKGGRPDLEQTSNDKMSWTSYGGKSEDAYLARVKKLQGSLKSQISTASGLQNEVSLILRDLIKAGVDPNLRRDLRDAGDSLQDRAKESQAEMDRWFAWYNTLVAEGRKTWKECEERRNELELAEKEWQSRSERARWVENDQSKQQPVDQASDEKRLAAMLERIDTSCLPIRAYFPSLYAPDLSASNTKAAVPRSLFAAHSYTHVPPFFQAIEAQLRHAHSRLEKWRRLENRLRRQRSGVETFLKDLSLVKATADGIRSSLNESSQTNLNLTVEDEIESQLEALKASEESLTAAVFTLIFFIEDATDVPENPPAIAVPFNLSQQDSCVRDFVHQQLANLAGELDQLSRDKTLWQQRRKRLRLTSLIKEIREKIERKETELHALLKEGLDGDVKSLISSMEELAKALSNIREQIILSRPHIEVFDTELGVLSITEAECEPLIPSLCETEKKLEALQQDHASLLQALHDEVQRRESIRQGWLKEKDALRLSLAETEGAVEVTSQRLQNLQKAVECWDSEFSRLEEDQAEKLANLSVKEFIMFQPVPSPSLDTTFEVMGEVSDLFNAASERLATNQADCFRITNSAKESFLLDEESSVSGEADTIHTLGARLQESQSLLTALSSRLESMQGRRNAWDEKQQDLQQKAEAARLKRINELNDWSAALAEIRSQLLDLCQINEKDFDQLSTEVSANLSSARSIYQTVSSEPVESEEIDVQGGRWSDLQQKLQRLQSSHAMYLERIDNLDSSFTGRCKEEDFASESSLSELVESVRHAILSARESYGNQDAKLQALLVENTDVDELRRNWLAHQKHLKVQKDAARAEWREALQSILREGAEAADTFSALGRSIPDLSARCLAIKTTYDLAEILHSEPEIEEYETAHSALINDCDTTVQQCQSLFTRAEAIADRVSVLSLQGSFPDTVADGNLLTQVCQSQDNLVERQVSVRSQADALEEVLESLKAAHDTWMENQAQLRREKTLAAERELADFRAKLQELRAAFDAQRVALTDLEKSVSETVIRFNNIIARGALVTNDMDTVQNALEDLRDLSQGYSAAQDALQSLQTERLRFPTVLTDVTSAAPQTILECQGEISSLGQSLNTWDISLEKCSSDLSSLQQRLSSSISDHKELLIALERIHGLIKQRERLESTLAKLTGAISDADASYTQSASIPDESTTQVLVDALKDLDVQVSALEQPFEVTQRDLTTFLTHHREVSATASLSASSSEGLIAPVDDLSHRVSSAGLTLRSLEAKVKAELERRIDIFNSQETRRLSISLTGADGSPLGDISDNHGSRILSQLRTRLNQLRVDAIDVSNSEERALRSLPTTKEFDDVQSHLVQLSNQAEDIEEDDVDEEELEMFMRDLRSKQRDLEVMSQLAEVATCLDVCDGIFSDLLDSVDDLGPDSDSGPFNVPSPTPKPSNTQTASTSTYSIDSNRSIVDKTFKTAKSSVEALHQAASPVKADCRVRRHLGRIDQTWDELSSLVLDFTGHSPATSVSNDPPISTPAKAPSTKKRERNKPPHITTGSSVASPSHPLSTPKQQNRTLFPRRIPSSDHLSSRTPPHPRTVTGPGPNTSTPRPKSAFGISSFSPVRLTSPHSASWSKTTANRFTSQLSPVQDAFPSIASKTPSTPNLQASKPPVRKRTTSTATARTRKSSTMSSRPPRRPNNYKANPKRQVDVQVGKIVNDLPVQITIAPVDTDTYQDQCGRYWIGDKDPKLCFCRILRSSTVMVRVGGGWQELGSFLLAHFGSSFSVNVSSSKGPEERWISSSTVQEAQKSINDLTNSTNTSMASPRVSLSSRVSLPGQGADSSSPPQPPDKFSLFMHKYDSPPKNKKIIIPWRY